MKMNRKKKERVEKMRKRTKNGERDVNDDERVRTAGSGSVKREIPPADGTHIATGMKAKAGRGRRERTRRRRRRR